MYEHKIHVQGVIWDINSYDQWGYDNNRLILQSRDPDCGIIFVIFAELSLASSWRRSSNRNWLQQAK